MARGKGRSGRRYVRDNRGRFATTGATARGGRLKTASGKKRETQTMKVSGAKAAGTISKPKGLKPGTIKAKPKSSSARKPIAKTSKSPVNKAQTAYKAARADARMRKNDLRGADINERRMANTAAAKVKNMERRRSASVPKTSADSPRSRQTAKEIARRQRAAANKRQAYDRWDKGMATDKDSRKASVAKRAQAIYEGRIDPKVKTRARLTQTQNPDVLRDRIKRGEKLTAAKAKKAASKRGKPAAKPKINKRQAAKSKSASQPKVTRKGGRIDPARQADRASTAKVNKAFSAEKAARTALFSSKEAFSSPKRQQLSRKLNEATYRTASEIQTRRNVRASFPVMRKTPTVKASRPSSTIKAPTSTKAQRNRASVNLTRRLDSRGRAIGTKDRRTKRIAERAAQFYSNPMKALKSVHKKGAGFKLPRSMRRKRK